MSTRAKFRCTAIKFTQSAKPNPALVEAHPDWAEKGYAERRELAEKAGLPETVPHDQPTVTLSAVTGGSEENESFFSATPIGTIEMTITNPDAAESFELGASYYVDFSDAPE